MRQSSLSLVAETRPELMRLPRGAQVAPLSGGVGLTLNVSGDIIGIENLEEHISGVHEKPRRTERGTTGYLVKYL